MEAVQFSTVASRHYSATGKTFYNSRISAGKSTKFVSSWAASSDPTRLSSTSRNLFTVSTTKLWPSLFGSVLKKRKQNCKFISFWIKLFTERDVGLDKLQKCYYQKKWQKTFGSESRNVWAVNKRPRGSLEQAQRRRFVLLFFHFYFLL